MITKRRRTFTRMCARLRPEFREKRWRKERATGILNAVTQMRFADNGPNARSIKVSFLLHHTATAGPDQGGALEVRRSDSTRRSVSLVTALGWKPRHFCMKKACLGSHKSGR